MTTRRLAKFAWTVCAVVCATRLQAQQQSEKSAGERLQLTSPSAEARDAFRTGLLQGMNVATARAMQSLDKSLQLDPNLALARVYRLVAQFTPELTPAERSQRMGAELARMSSASAAEIAAATAWREQAAGRTSSAIAMWKAAAELAPNDADIAYLLLLQQLVGRTTADQIVMLRNFVARFPDHAVAYNVLAIRSWDAGDRAGAYAAVEQYARNAPDMANPHDTWSGLLLYEGKRAEATEHERVAMSLDPAFWQGHVTFADIDVANGNPSSALTHLQEALRASPNIGSRITNEHSVAALYLLMHKTKEALSAYANIAAEADAKKLPPAMRALPHQRMAWVEALFGTPLQAERHLQRAAEIEGATTANQHMYTALAYVAMGRVDEARNAVANFAAVAPGNSFVYTLSGLINLQAGAVDQAASDLAKSDASDLLARSLRIDVLKKQGKESAAQVVRQEVLNNGLLNATFGLEITKVVARLRAETT